MDQDNQEPPGTSDQEQVTLITNLADAWVAGLAHATDSDKPTQATLLQPDDLAGMLCLWVENKPGANLCQSTNASSSSVSTDITDTIA